LGIPLSRLHPQAALAELVHEGPGDVQAATGGQTFLSVADKDKIEAFANTHRPPEELYAETRTLHGEFAYAGAWLGAWVGLVVGVKLISLSIRRRRDEYQPDRGNCVSCGRCFWYCPEEQVRLGLIEIGGKVEV
jgi:ferredoxin